MNSNDMHKPQTTMMDIAYISACGVAHACSYSEVDNVRENVPRESRGTRGSDPEIPAQREGERERERDRDREIEE